VEEDLKKTILTEYRSVVAQMQEARDTIAVLEPRFQVLAKLLETYGWQGDANAIGPDDDARSGTEESKTKGEKIAALSMEFFTNNRNQWTRLSDLYLYLTDKGLNIGGKNPSSTLSAHLSNSALFEGSRTRGWRLRALPVQPEEVKANIME
jgi:hypothetical protein